MRFFIVDFTIFFFNCKIANNNSKYKKELYRNNLAAILSQPKTSLMAKYILLPYKTASKN
jgi:hypothetical protein